VQQRGAEVLSARGKSSAASAANAIINTVQSILSPTLPDQLFSLAVLSDHNPYDIASDLVFSFPCRSQGRGDWEIVPNLSLDSFLKEKIRITEKELLDEKQMVSHLLTKS